MIFQKKTITLHAPYDKNENDTECILECFIPNDNEENLPYSQNRKSVLILPGGGYVYTSEREAEPIALEFVTKGMNAYVLYYDVAPSVFPKSLLQALTAIGYIREKAKEYHADENEIYVCGFSAGGHLAASTGTLWNKKEARDYFDNVERVKPNGLILAYPVIISDDGKTHQGSFDNLLGDKKDDKAMREYLSLDKQVSSDTPKSFIWSTFEDEAVPCYSAIRFASALKNANVPFELHIWEKGRHGLSTGDTVVNYEDHRVHAWLNEVFAWMNGIA